MDEQNTQPEEQTGENTEAAPATPVAVTDLPLTEAAPVTPAVAPDLALTEPVTATPAVATDLALPEAAPATDLALTEPVTVTPAVATEPASTESQNGHGPIAAPPSEPPRTAENDMAALLAASDEQFRQLKYGD